MGFGNGSTAAGACASICHRTGAPRNGCLRAYRCVMRLNASRSLAGREGRCLGTIDRGDDSGFSLGANRTCGRAHEGSSDSCAGPLIGSVARGGLESAPRRGLHLSFRRRRHLRGPRSLLGSCERCFGVDNLGRASSQADHGARCILPGLVFVQRASQEGPAYLRCSHTPSDIGCSHVSCGSDVVARSSSGRNILLGGGVTLFPWPFLFVRPFQATLAGPTRPSCRWAGLLKEGLGTSPPPPEPQPPSRLPPPALFQFKFSTSEVTPSDL